MTRTLSAAILFLCIFLGCNKSPKYSNQVEDPVQFVLDSLVRAMHLPGANLSIFLGDQTMHNYSSGYADTLNKIPMTPDHVMFSGSVGKTYAVALLMQDLDQGLFALEDLYISHFPEETWLNRLPGMEKITIRMLLQHTSGLPEYVMQAATWDSLFVNPDKIWSYYDRMEIIFDHPSVHEPGKGWAYSDTNYILLGMLIEKLCQENYYEYLSSRILIPKKLKRTYASIERDLEGLPQGYSRLPPLFRMPGQVVEEGRYVFNPQMEWTGGGLASTTSDLAKWARIYYNGTLFSDSLRELIVTPSQQGLNLGPGMAYGMGSFIYQTNFGRAWAHTGFVPGFNSIFAYYPELDLALALQSNCDYASQQMALIDFLDVLLTSQIN